MPQPPDVLDAVFTLGAENTNVINVGVSLRKYGTKADQRLALHYWLSSDAAGDALATDPGTTAIGTDGTLLVEPVDDLIGMVVTEADGDFDLNITHTGTSGFYLNLVVPGSGRVVTSPIIQFA